MGSYDSYEQAQAAVDYLSDEKFPVENVTIIGSDLRMIEKVTGRLTQGRAIAAGAAGGAWWGLFVGLLLGILLQQRRGWIGSVLTGLLIGARVRRGLRRDGLRRHPGPARLHQHQQDRRQPLRRACATRRTPRRPGPSRPLLPPRLTPQRRVAKAIAAAAATPSESTPGRIGMRARTRGRLLGLGRQPGPLGAQQDGGPRVLARVDVGQVHRVGGRGERDGRVAGVVQPVEAGRPVRQDGERQRQDVAHRDPHRAAVERVGAARVEQQAVDPQRERRAGDRPEVLARR